MNTLLQDLRFAVRMLRKTPGVSAIAILTLALSIGANATLFTWFKAAVLRPLPGAADTGRLVTMNGVLGERGGLSNNYPGFVYFREHASVFSGLTGYELIFLNLGSEGQPEVVSAGIVSGNYFDVLGVRLARGRGFLTDEDATPDTHPVAVISDSLWRRRFGAEPGIIGKAITLNRHPFTIIGVAPAQFAGTYGGLAQEIWVPFMMQSQVVPDADLLKGGFGFQIMGRLSPGKGIAEAQAEMHLLAHQFAETRPDTLRGYDVRVYPLYQSERGIQSSIAQVLPILMGICGLVLLIACSNVANLLLARSLARRKEVALRLALGATRMRLARQMLTESFLLAALGGATGLLLALLTRDSLYALLPPFGTSFAFDLRIDGWVLGFTIAATLFTGFLFGMAPVLQASRADVGATLKNEASSVAGGFRKSFLRNGLVVSQIALSLVALVCAGLFLRTLELALRANPGFTIARAQLADVDLSLNGYDQARGREFFRRAQETLSSVPGVEAVSISSYVPLGLSGGGNSRRVTVEGYTPGPRENEIQHIVTDTIGPGYLRTMGIPLAAGREFTARDDENAPGVAVVNESMAHRYWPGQDAVGKRLMVGGKWQEVVGVAREIKYRVLDESPSPAMYLPAWQNYSPQMTLVVRTMGEPGAVWPAAERALRQLDSTLPLAQVATLAEHARSSFFLQRAASLLLSAFGLLALTLSAAGLYGVMSFSVNQRMHELGIRVALGAQPARIMRLVLGQGLLLTLGGVALGLAGALALGRVLSSMLLGLNVADPLTFASVTLLLAAVALVACVFPARRATRVDPVITLRHE
jgi:predicted permease